MLLGSQQCLDGLPEALSPSSSSADTASPAGSQGNWPRVCAVMCPCVPVCDTILTSGLPNPQSHILAEGGSETPGTVLLNPGLTVPENSPARGLPAPTGQSAVARR